MGAVLASSVTLAFGWQPEIRGIVVVLIAVGVLMGSVYLILSTDLGARLGLMVALGILLDTFIVRTIMVPAAVEVIGDKIWWPSTARAGGRIREDTGEHALPEPSEAG